MGIEFRLPELGENVPAGTVGKLLVAVGDTITAGQNVLEIETDKAVAEIPCDVAGKVVEIRAVEGEKINVGDIVLILEAVAESEKPAKEAPPPTAAPQTEKKAATPAQPVAAAQAPKPATQAQARPGLVRAAPSVRRLAREHDVDLNEVPIADPSGKATAQDILAFVAARESGAAVSASAPVSAAATPMPAPSAGAEEQHLASDRWGTIVQEAMNTIRIRTAERLSESWQTIP
ncbi:MAG: branched-chain alpha-keto acid dehydrogenase subunit E2, partial [Candidatus Hydrogenedentes bacterium]|nr:branched-chain alpha-keto acid dehydrogenase subunit E2 [Candidatus Hydrogenedentota bacterium]